MPWDIILCVDQSGSMLNSVIHSTVLAGILCRLPMLNVKLVIFDTAVVDLSEYVDDQVETLMNIQLGGGTDIGKALRYCEQLIKNPSRTVLILISDFEEGASPQVLMATSRRLAEAGVTLLGLASLDDEAEPCYDRKMAERMAENGMEIAALTSKHLADWLAKVIASDPLNIKPYLIGQHRRKYIDTGEFHLHGVAAYQWATQSDFHSLTVLFWDLSAKQWFTWSEARPRFHNDKITEETNRVCEYDNAMKFINIIPRQINPATG